MSSSNLDFGENIEFSIKKRFGIITLNRIQRSNAFTIELLLNLKEAVDYCQKAEKIRGLILTNNGNSFSTGIDLGEIDGSDHKAVKYLESTAASICKLLYNGKPAICAINGRTLGEGVVFLTCCDYRIATKESFFQMPEINSGIFPGTGCVLLFSKIIGIPWTKKMLMFSEKIYSEKALEIGLIDQLVNSKEDLIQESMSKARFLFTKNQTVINAIKLCSNHLLDKTFAEGYKIEKLGSAWYEYENQDDYIQKLRTEFEWDTT
ncbi:MAG: enoyl-CoA hydratase/isomerase family protein [Candidatus Thorarchaeota archaeon]